MQSTSTNLFFQAEDGIRDTSVTGVQTCALPIYYFALLCLLIITARGFAWGPEGHRIIADVARSHLTASARSQVRALLGDDDLAAVANWADGIKSDRPETAAWHFVDIPMSAADFSDARDCYRPDPRHLLSGQDHHN